MLVAANEMKLTYRRTCEREQRERFRNPGFP